MNVFQVSDLDGVKYVPPEPFRSHFYSDMGMRWDQLDEKCLFCGLSYGAFKESMQNGDPIQCVHARRGK